MTDISQTAYLIVGSRINEFKGAAIGVAFFPDPPARQVLRKMGFHVIQTMERVAVDTNAVKEGGATVPKEPTLFFFERGPNPTATFVAELQPNGSLGTVKREALGPSRVIPRLSGSQAERWIPKPTGPELADAKRLAGPGSNATGTDRGQRQRR